MKRFVNVAPPSKACVVFHAGRPKIASYRHCIKVSVALPPVQAPPPRDGKVFKRGGQIVVILVSNQ